MQGGCLTGSNEAMPTASSHSPQGHLSGRQRVELPVTTKTKFWGAPPPPAASCPGPCPGTTRREAGLADGRARRGARRLRRRRDLAGPPRALGGAQVALIGFWVQGARRPADAPARPAARASAQPGPPAALRPHRAGSAASPAAQGRMQASLRQAAAPAGAARRCCGPQRGPRRRALVPVLSTGARLPGPEAPLAGLVLPASPEPNPDPCSGVAQGVACGWPCCVGVPRRIMEERALVVLGRWRLEVLQHQEVLHARLLNRRA